MFWNVIKVRLVRIVCFVGDHKLFRINLFFFCIEGSSFRPETFTLFAQLSAPKKFTIKIQLPSTPFICQRRGEKQWSVEAKKELVETKQPKALSENKQLIFRNGKVFRAIFINNSPRFQLENSDEIIYGREFVFMALLEFLHQRDGLVEILKRHEADKEI